MTDYAPSRYWYADKNGTPVKKYDTEGKTLIDLPDSVDPVACDSREQLESVETDASVLTDAEAETLGIVR